MIYCVTLIGSAVIAACLTWIVRNVGNRLGLAVGPASSRHIHARPIPRLGGIAIFLTFLILGIVYCSSILAGLLHSPKDPQLLKLLIPASFLFLVGLIDDLRGLSARLKLGAQVIAAVFLYAGGYRFICVHSSHGIAPVMTILCLSLTVLWVVLVCNAINLIDGLDGLAAGAALFSMVTIFTFALVSGRHGIALTLAALAGANIGFLLFNFNPASIFLGDSGSLFIGFMISGLAMSESQKQPNTLRTILIPILSLALPLTDLIITILRRSLSGHSLFRPDRGHIHHKLLDRGLTQRQVVFILYTFSASCTLLGLLLMHSSGSVLIPGIALVVLFLFFGIRKLDYQEFAELGRLMMRLRQQPRIAAANIAVKRACQQLEATYNTAALADILEHCLRKDFNGFEIVLDDRFSVQGEIGPIGVNTIERAWALSGGEPLVMTMDLSTLRTGRFGRIILEHGSGMRLLVDSELIQKDLRIALSSALEHCLLTPPDSADSKQGQIEDRELDHENPLQNGNGLTAGAGLR